MMHTLFAEMAPTTSEFGGFWLVALSGLSGLSALASLVALFWRDRKREISPQPLIVEMAKEFTSHADFMRHMEDNQREYEKLHSKIGGVERGTLSRMDNRFADLEKKSDESQIKIHERINDVLKAVCRVEGEIKARFDR